MILLLGDESTYMVGFKEALINASYGYDRVQSEQDLYEKVKTLDYKLIVFCYDENKQVQEMMDKFVQKYPQFPVVYILPHDTDFEYGHHFNIFRKIVRPLSSKKEFKNVLDDMILLSDSLASHSKHQTLPLQFFDTLELNTVIDKVFRHFNKTVKCNNVHWIIKEEFNRIIDSFQSGEELEPLPTFNRSVLLQSSEDVDAQVVVDLLKNFNITENYLGKPMSLEFENDELKSHLLPIYRQSNKEVLAYLLFEGLDAESSDFYVKQINETLGIMSKHIGFSVDFWAAQRLSFVDHLTGLYNQEYLELVVKNEISRSQRQKKDFTVLFIDIDHFKQVNDKNGHWIGSKVLIELGKSIKGLLRTTDYAFRYGGDEFVVVLPDTSSENATVVAERIRKFVENSTFKIDEVDLNITVSIGLASFPEHAKTHKDIIQIADRAMYCGKNLSRNVVYNAS